MDGSGIADGVSTSVRKAKSDPATCDHGCGLPPQHGSVVRPRREPGCGSTTVPSLRSRSCLP